VSGGADGRARPGRQRPRGRRQRRRQHGPAPASRRRRRATPVNLSAWIESLMPHLVVAPILLPMLTAALMLLLGDTRRPLKAALNVLASAAGVLVAAALVLQVQRSGAAQSIGVYLPGNWPVPYGIVLVADRLSAMMLLLGSLLGLAGVLYAS